MSAHLYVRTLDPLLMPLVDLTSSQSTDVIAVNNTGEATPSPRTAVLNKQNHDALRKILGELNRQRLFVVSSTTGCHEYHRDQILTESDLSIARNRGITVHVDNKGWY